MRQRATLTSFRPNACALDNQNLGQRAASLMLGNDNRKVIGLSGLSGEKGYPVEDPVDEFLRLAGTKRPDHFRKA
jgi:hypothetical protein